VIRVIVLVVNLAVQQLEAERYAVAFGYGWVRIGFTLGSLRRLMVLFEVLSPDDCAAELFRKGSSGRRKNVVIERNSRGVITTAEARDIANLYVFGARRGKRRLQGGTKLGGAIQVTTEIATDSQVGFGRDGEMKMRIKACDTMNLVERGLGSLRKRFQLRLWQKAMTSLDSAEVVEDQGARLKGVNGAE